MADSRSGSDDGSNDVDFLFANLGGSLMKDLLADLAVGDDEDEWLNLEQLEQELNHLDSGPTNNAAFLSPSSFPSSAAGMVVQSQAATSNSLNLNPPAPAASTTSAPVDAWSLSLQKFTATSLEADFLKADSDRKQQQVPTGPPPGLLGTTKTTTTKQPKRPPPGMSSSSAAAAAPPPPPGMSSSGAAGAAPPPPGMIDLSTAEDYNISETTTETTAVPTVAPLGLLGTASIAAANASMPVVIEAAPTKEGTTTTTTTTEQEILNEAAAKLVQELHQPPEQRQRPQQQQQQSSMIPPPGVVMPKPVPMTPQNSVGFQKPPPPPPGVGARQQQQPPQQLPVVPVAIPLPKQQGGPAWQQQPQQHPPPPPHMQQQHHHHMPPPQTVFANPRPEAPSVPAQVLESRFMKARDICYVVHGILKPILLAQSNGSFSTYDTQFWARREAIPPIVKKPPTAERQNYPKKKPDPKEGDHDETAADKLEAEMKSRDKKAREWSHEKGVLGHTSKTNVARPRALIAVNASKSKEDDQQNENDTTMVLEQPRSKQQRAALWKSRIYCDQAYQAYQAVVDIWSAATPGQGNPTAAVQPHLLKLLKCLGISKTTTTTQNAVPPNAAAQDENQSHVTTTTTSYTVDPNVLTLLLKLAKGKRLLARVLEQALLPPAVVQALLPDTLKVLFQMSNPSTRPGDNSTAMDGNTADDSLFAALARVIQTLPDLSPVTLLQACQAIQEYSHVALQTTTRMQCTHALLHRGGVVAQSAGQAPEDPAAQAFVQQWTQTEQTFMNILAGM